MENKNDQIQNNNEALNNQDNEKQPLIQQPNPQKKDEAKGNPKANVQQGESGKYMYLEGLRGTGALVVYLHHFTKHFHPMVFYGKPKDPREYEATGGDPPQWLYFASQSPLNLILNGPFWVILFFIISGFVLPLSWFKSRRHSSIWGGVFRRYLRLMLPVLGILPLYYIVAQLDFTTQDKTLKKVKVKNIWELFLDTIIGTWFGNNDYACVTWTLGVELWASFYVYLLAETVVFYRSRWILYTVAILVLFIPRITEQNKLTNYQFTLQHNNSLVDLPLRNLLPHFFIGVIFCDMDNSEHGSYIDPVRKLSLWWKIPLNTLLIILFFFYGGTCANIWQATVGSVAGFLLALTSQWFQWLLETIPFTFLGKISYTIYLVHMLFIEWPELELAAYFRGQGVSYGEAEIYVFLIFTPILFLFSWLLEFIVDTPSKNFSHNLDLFLRIEAPKPRNGKQEDQNTERSCWKFMKNQWIIWGLLIYLSLTVIVTESYGAANGNKERIHAMGKKELQKN